MNPLKGLISRKQAKPGQSGQALLEFALIFPALIAIVMGLMEFGVYFMTYHTVQNASREGARTATTLIDLQEDDTRVVSFVDTLIPVSGPLAGFNGNTTNNAISDCEVNDQVTVTVTGTYNFVALNVLGLNGIEMTVPTTMHYELCESYTYQGAPDTATPGPSDTPQPPTNTPTPTASNTPTVTNTPTITPTPSCNVSGGSLSASGWDVYWPITNNGTATERISRIYFDWVDSPSYQYVYDIWLGSNRIHTGGDGSPPTDYSSGWIGSGSRRDIAPSQTRTLTLEFYTNHGTAGIDIIVEFESGCSVTLPSSPTATPTSTSAPGCSVSGGSFDYDGDDIYWDLVNSSSTTERISNVWFSWVDSPSSQYFDKIYLGGNRFHSGNDNSPDTTLSSGWYGGDYRRELSGNSTEELNIDFRYSHPSNSISITVTFESGCEVSIVNAVESGGDDDDDDDDDD